MMRRVYIETSVWSMIHPDQPAALREASIKLLEQCRDRIHLPHISDVVLQEVREAPGEKQQAVLDRIASLSPVLLPMSENAVALAKRFIDAGILSEARLDDARHVACAMLGGVDVLISWNYRHIANVRKAEKFRAAAVLSGNPSILEIHTPLEFVEWT